MKKSTYVIVYTRLSSSYDQSQQDKEFCQRNWSAQPRFDNTYVASVYVWADQIVAHI